MRRLLYQFHLYLGLFAGAVFVVLGVTGSLLIFDHAIDETLDPALFTAQSPGPPVPVQDMLDAAAGARPEAAPFRIIMPRHERGVAVVWSTLPEDEYLVTYVDPGSGEVLGSQVWGDSLMTFIYKLHFSLLLDHEGEAAVGVIGLLMLISIGTGLVLWWPGLGRMLQAFKIRLPARGYRLHFELHKASGFYTAILLFVIVFSGIYLVFPAQVTGLVGAVLPVTDSPGDLQSTPRPDATPIAADRAVAMASALFPDAALKRVILPEGSGGVYRIGLRQPGEVQQSYGQTQVWIEQYSGEVLAVRDYHDAAPGSRFLDWQFSLHNGEAFGLAGRWLVFVLGFVPLVLYVTGFTLWWKTRKARRRRGGREHAALSPGNP